LTEQQRIKYILKIQKIIGRKFKKFLNNNIVSSIELKKIMDYVIENYDYVSLDELQELIIIYTELYISNK
jgi:hypothetical protein